MIKPDERPLQQRFSALSRKEDDSDWADVLIRARISDRQRTRMFRPAVLLAVATTFALGVGFAAALGIRLRPAAAASPPGPRTVQRHVGTGTVKWLFDHQPRGQSLAAAHIAIGSTVGSHSQPVKFARAISPDPNSSDKIVLSLIGKHGRNSA